LKYSAGLGQHGIGTEAKVFILFVLFLLATPIGFAVNALSWLLIDYSICGFERLYFTWSRTDGRIFPLWDVTEARFGRTLNDYFGLREDNFNLAGWFFRDVLEAYVPERFETQTHIKGLVVFLRNLTLFAIVLAFISLWNAVGLTLWLVAVGLAAAGTVTLLVNRWDAVDKDVAKRRKQFNVGAGVVTMAGFLVALLGVTPTDGHWYVRAVILLLGAALTTAVIGMVEYYYHDAILLHAYFACHEYGVTPPETSPATSAPGNDRIMLIARELIQKIGERSREKNPPTHSPHEQH
jgi:hypothetical protein